MGIKRALRLSIATFILAGAVSAVGQTVALRGNGNLYLKFARTDTLKRNALDLTRVVDWQLDTTGKDGDQKWAKEIDWQKSIQPFVWLAVSDDPLSHPATKPWLPTKGLIMPESKLALFIAGHFYNAAAEFDVLTVWDLVGSDSVRFRCGVLTEYFEFNGEIKIVNATRLPDSSVLLYVQGSSNANSEYGEDNWFYRITSPCGAQLIYKSSWHEDFRNQFKRVRYGVDTFDNEPYKISEITEFGKKDFSRSPGMHEDSTRHRTIDLWELAQQKLLGDTTGSDLSR